MEWLNLNINRDLRSPEFIGSDPVQRATWLCLIGYCVNQENAGIIVGCGLWPDRKWQQICGVTLEEVKQECDLWHWDGESLKVHLYPHEKEALVQTNRLNAKAGGVASGKARRQAKANRNRSENEATASTADEAVVEQPLERKGSGREGKGKGKEEEGKQEPTAKQETKAGDSHSDQPSRATTTRGMNIEAMRARERMRFIANRYSCTTVMEGKDITHEWCQAVEDFDIEYVASLFEELGNATPRLPSDLRRILKGRRTDYQTWLGNRSKKAQA